MNRVRIVLVIGGILCVLFGFAALSAPPSTAVAQSLPERPTLTPTGATSPKSSEPAPVATSRITGTIIDSRTGAPTAGVTVQVGDVQVVSDANGNYDRNGLVAGAYTVALVLPAERGVADQAAITLDLGENQTIVQHLAFHSPAPVSAEPAPVPAALPKTGGSEPGILLLTVGLGMLVAAGLMRRRAS